MMNSGSSSILFPSSSSCCWPFSTPPHLLYSSSSSSSSSTISTRCGVVFPQAAAMQGQGQGQVQVKGRAIRLPFPHHRHQRQRQRSSLRCINTTTTTSSPLSESESSLGLELELQEIKAKCQKWEWRGYSINYFKFHSPPQQQQEEEEEEEDQSPPLLLVHGFGASILHWRRNIAPLAQSNNTVYAIDLLGFGGSDKPTHFAYTMESWAELILDFLEQIVHKPTVLIGNSVGSLACVIAASESKRALVRGLVLLNCAGGMNNKAVVDDWRIKLFFPLLLLIDFLLKQRSIASAIFERVKQRENLRNILLSVYGNKDSVDDDLVEIIKRPADDEGALDAFVSIITGPPGPNPVQLMPQISLPVLILWGDQDTFTPLDGPVGRYFSSLPSQLQNISLYVLEGVGHCPHDDRPDLVHEKLLPWLSNLPAS